MISKTWQTSERKYGVMVERDVTIPVEDGINLDCDLFRPAAEGRFPAVLGVHPFEKSWQSGPTMPRGFYLLNGSIEAKHPEKFGKGTIGDVAFGIIGYLLRKFEYELAPLVIAFVLEPILFNLTAYVMFIMDVLICRKCSSI